MELIRLDRTTYNLTTKGKEVLKKYGKSFNLSTLRDLEGYEVSLQNPNSKKTHWVTGHYRPNGDYVAGYASGYFAKGLRKRIDSISDNTKKEQ